MGLFVLGHQTQGEVIDNIHERDPHYPCGLVGILQQAPDADRAVEIGEHERELAQVAVAARVNIFDGDEDHDVEEHQKAES
jgi:hypothetical protein